MMAKPAATKIRLRSKHNSRPPRSDPPLLRHLPPPTPPEIRRRRSLRPRRRRQLSEGDAYEFDHDEVEEEEEEREQKKLRLVVKLPRSAAVRPRRALAVPLASTSSFSPSPSLASSSSSSYVNEDELGENGDDEVETVKPPKKRRIDRCGDVDMCRSINYEESKKNSVGRPSGDGSANLPSSWCGTPMPEKDQLELILQKLQKKDTYGAFAEPVDPEELPDYHDVIEHPMDFGTIRKKLDRGAYRFFEQFEDDVLLICSNAMQYNAPDTIYFRQACAIQDLARKKFQSVRENTEYTRTELTEQRSEEKSTSIFMDKKYAKKMQCKVVAEPILSDISSGATLASAGDTSTGLSTVNGIEKSVAVNGLLEASSSQEQIKQGKSVAVNELLDASSSLGVTKQEKSFGVNGLLNLSSRQDSKPEKFVPANEFLDAGSLGESSKQNKGDDYSAKCSPSKVGRKVILVDENRRTTYSTALEQRPMVESDLVLDFYEDEQKLLVPVGVDAEHSYARSLARFTASLGPCAWGIVSRKLEKALPPGIKFGQGWVGEYEPCPASFLSVENCNHQLSDSSPSCSRSTVKVAESGQTPSSGNLEFGIKKQSSSKSSRKAPNSCKNASCEDSAEQKPTFLRKCTAGQKQFSDSNNTIVGVDSLMNNRNSSVASVRVKEESPCEEIAEKRQEVIRADELTQPSAQMNLNMQKNRTTADFSKAFPPNNSCKKASNANFTQNFSRESGHTQAENLKTFQAVSSPNLNNAPEISLRGSNDESRVSNSFAFVPSNQTGVNYGLGRDNNHDSLKLASFSRNVSNQPNFPRMSHAEQSMPIVLPIKKENFSPATSAAARAWMSVGTSGQWKSVDAKNLPEKLSISPFCSPTWKPPISASQFTAYSMARTTNLPLQVEALPQAKNSGLVIFPQLIPTDLSKYKNHPSWQASSPQPQSKQRDNLPPDLNIGYQAPASPIQPSSSMAMDSQQPDLALQL